MSIFSQPIFGSVPEHLADPDVFLPTAFQNPIEPDVTSGSDLYTYAPVGAGIKETEAYETLQSWVDGVWHEMDKVAPEEREHRKRAKIKWFMKLAGVGVAGLGAGGLFYWNVLRRCKKRLAALEEKAKMGEEIPVKKVLAAIAAVMLAGVGTYYATGIGAIVGVRAFMPNLYKFLFGGAGPEPISEEKAAEIEADRQRLNPPGERQGWMDNMLTRFNRVGTADLTEVGRARRAMAKQSAKEKRKQGVSKSDLTAEEQDAIRYRVRGFYDE